MSANSYEQSVECEQLSSKNKCKQFNALYRCQDLNFGRQRTDKRIEVTSFRASITVVVPKYSKIQRRSVTRDCIYNKR